MELAGEAELLGALYVLEGSALGARLIMKSAQALGLGATFGARHLAAQAGDALAWRSYLDLLLNAPLDDAGEATLHRAAAAVFDHFAYAYSRRLSP